MGKVEQESVRMVEYIIRPFWSDDPNDLVRLKDSPREKPEEREKWEFIDEIMALIEKEWERRNRRM